LPLDRPITRACEEKPLEIWNAPTKSRLLKIRVRIGGPHSVQLEIGIEVLCPCSSAIATDASVHVTPPGPLSPLAGTARAVVV
jgi:hypothetical protein